jgi:stage III sporulation protein AG
MFRDLSKLPKWVWLVGVLGVAFMLVGTFVNTSTDKQIRAPNSSDSSQTQTSQPQKNPSAFSDYEQMYDNQLESMLNQLPGVEGAQVMVTFESTPDIIYAENQQTTKQTTNESGSGTTRTITQINENGQLVMMQQNGNNTPVIEKTIMPNIRGVLVIAKGAQSAVVQEQIQKAVESVLDVPLYKISVLPKK